MKKRMSLPQNQDFFDRYATLTPTLYRLGWLGQVISALLEFGPLYAILRMGLQDITPTYAHPIALVGALVFTLFIEIGLRKFGTYSARSIVHKRYKGLDLAMTVIVILIFLTCALSSGVLSFKGSYDLTEYGMGNAQGLAVLDTAAHQEQLHQNYTQYQRDSNTLATGFAAQIQSTRNKYQARINALKSDIVYYQNRAKRKKKSYQSAIDKKNRVIERVKEQQQYFIDSLTHSQSAGLANLQNKRDSSQQAIMAVWTTTQTDTKQSNETKTDKHNSKINRYGGFLGAITLIALAIVILSIFMQEIIHKGADMEEKALPNDYYFRESVWAELVNMLSDKFNYKLRNWIGKYSEKTPPPPPMQTPPTIYHIKNLRSQVKEIDLEVEEETEATGDSGESKTDEIVKASPTVEIEVEEIKNCGTVEAAEPIKEIEIREIVVPQQLQADFEKVEKLKKKATEYYKRSFLSKRDETKVKNAKKVALITAELKRLGIEIIFDRVNLKTSFRQLSTL
jgi:hypothetical protein